MQVRLREQPFEATADVASSMHIPNLPLVFVLVMASPPTPSYLHSAYPRSTLALLTVQQVLAPTGPATIKGILTKVLIALSTLNL